MLEQSEPMCNTSPTAALYMELPYPADGVVRTMNARIMLAGLRQHAPEMLSRKKLRILDVGCGTGESTIGLARFFPQAEICGADINPASLELACNLAHRVGASVQFVQCDVTRNLAEKLHQASPGPFDIVSSVGVLHHLTDPRVGFSAVRQIIRPDGRFYCFMYSHFGRREEIAIKTLLNEVLPGNTSWRARANALSQLRLGNKHSLWNGIKRIRRRLKFGPPLRPWEVLRALLNRNRLVHESDTYSNPCEHLYRFGELKSLLAETGWEFLALARQAGLPTTPEEHTGRPGELAVLREMPLEALFDYFAFFYEAWGFSLFCRPHDSDHAALTGSL
jgi:SAM-dependent methyltransferase